jgi:hypothetical protein
MPDILSKNFKDAKKMLLRSESYFSSDLPPYFKFDKMLNDIDTELLKFANFKDCFAVDNAGKTIKPESISDINHKIITNKDGFYAWRPLYL